MSQTFPAEPTLKDLLDLHRKGIFLDLNCHHLGTVQSFDPAKQTATVTINYQRSQYQYDNELKTNKVVLLPYPLLTDCPVVFLGGAAGALTFPVAQKDECLVLFNDRDMDNWFAGQSNDASAAAGDVATTRLHSFSDAVVLVGVRSLGKVLTDFDQSRVVLKNGTTLVGVGASLIKLANNSFTLNQLVQELISELQSLTVICPSGGGPSSTPLNAGALGATAAKFSQLLE